MSSKENLYFLKFNPILKDKIWGGSKLHQLYKKGDGKTNQLGESWEISAVPGDVSVVSEGALQGKFLTALIGEYKGELLGEKPFKKHGEAFPLLIKFIDAQQELSIQVHPDDALGMKRHQSLGKTEMWYILDAEPEAKLVSGFIKGVDKAAYLDALEAGTVASVFHQEPVQQGDTFFIPAGHVHSIGAGIVLAEIQQSSDVTYRIYDFDRRDANGNLRELHIEKALDAIQFEEEGNAKTHPASIKNESVLLAECEYFTTNKIWIEGSIGRDYHAVDSFVIYMCTKGTVMLTYDDGRQETLNKGESGLLPAAFKSCHIQSEKGAEILEVYLPNNE